MDEETKIFNAEFRTLLNEFDEEDDGEADDSWWWEEGRHNKESSSNQANSPIETDYSSASEQHKVLTPQDAQREFNSYEQCNRLILSSASKKELIQHFCDIIDVLTSDDKEAQIKLINMINSVDSDY